MNNLQVFKNTEFGEVRVIENDGEPWFVGKDVAEILGYSNPRKALADHVDDEDKMDGVTIRDSIGREQTPTFINESGLYSLILRSQLPQAKKFKRWVTSEVLPAIRKQGTYSLPSSPMDALKLMFEATKEIDGKVDSVNADLQEFKRDMPILGIEESRITYAVRKKGVDCMGGKDTAAYKDKSLRSKIYTDIYGQLKREFGVGSYKAIKRNQTDHAVQMIQAYTLPFTLEERVEQANQQVEMSR